MNTKCPECGETHAICEYCSAEEGDFHRKECDRYYGIVSENTAQPEPAPKFHETWPNCPTCSKPLTEPAPSDPLDVDHGSSIMFGEPAPLPAPSAYSHVPLTTGATLSLSKPAQPSDAAATRIKEHSPCPRCGSTAGPAKMSCDLCSACFAKAIEESDARDARDEFALAQRIYEPKYGGKDHSGYETLMKYEVNDEREEAAIAGWDACAAYMKREGK